MRPAQSGIEFAGILPMTGHLCIFKNRQVMFLARLRLAQVRLIQLLQIGLSLGDALLHIGQKIIWTDLFPGAIRFADR